MLNKLTDNQRTLLLVMIEDLKQFDANEFVILKETLIKVYNDGEYRGGTKAYLNGAREYWLKNIYGEDLSCWNEIKKMNKTK